MKIFEKELKRGFLEIYKKRREERMLQYKFKDDFLQSLQNVFEQDSEQTNTSYDENLEVVNKNVTAENTSNIDE